LSYGTAREEFQCIKIYQYFPRVESI